MGSQQKGTALPEVPRNAEELKALLEAARAEGHRAGLEEAAKRIEEHAAHYPEDVWPKVDLRLEHRHTMNVAENNAAQMARHTCKVLAAAIRAIDEGESDESDRTTR